MRKHVVIFYSSSSSSSSEQCAALVQSACLDVEIVKREIPSDISSQFLRSLNQQPFALSFVAIGESYFANLQMFVTHLRSTHPESTVIVGYKNHEEMTKSRLPSITGVFSAALGTEGIRSLVLEQLENHRELHSNSHMPYDNRDDLRIIGASPAFRRVLDMIPQAAKSVAPILITGETGTGKEVFARAIHYTGPRARMARIAVQCSAIAPDLFENDLFGHESGAYTGAGAATKGLVGASEGGTLFLDEIDSLRLDLQAKILRLVEEHEYRPVGSSEIKKANIRILCATNADLKSLIAKGAFREDLYYRIAGINIKLPPLRERRDDIPALTRYFLKRSSGCCGKICPRLDESALHKLMAYDWPGNVRELAHVLEQASTYLERNEISADCLDLPGAPPAEEMLPFKVAKARAIETFDREYLTKFLLISDWNVSKAARKAHMDRTVFWRRIRQLGVKRPQVEIDASREQDEDTGNALMTT